MITRAFYGRVLIEKVQDETKKTVIKGLEDGEIQKVKILDWGTEPDGEPFGGKVGLTSGMIAYIRVNTMGINLGNNKFIIERSSILGF